MSTTVVNITTPGSSTHTVDSGVTGDVTVEAWGIGSVGQNGAVYGGYGGGGGGFAKGTFTISGGTVLAYTVPAAGAAGDGWSILSPTTVVDSSTTGTLVSVQADGAYYYNGGNGATGGSLITSSVTRLGGAADVDPTLGGGGGSSGCPTAAGNSASGQTAGSSAGTLSGAGGNGGGVSGNGVSGSNPGGGGGSGGSTVGNTNGGAAGNGRIRITYDVGAPPGGKPRSLLSLGVGA